MAVPYSARFRGKNLSLIILQILHSDNMIIIPSDSTNIAMLPGNGARKRFDNPQVYGTATVFEGRVFNPNL